MLKQIIEHDPDQTFIKADGFDNAVIGVCLMDKPRLIYSVSKCLEILKTEMTEIDAFEHFTYNVFGSYVGDQTPIWSWDNY